MEPSHNRHKIRVIISGGGTGGHIFPAIAIANTLRARIPGIDILFIGAKDKMEMEKVPAAGYPIEGLWISGLQRKLTWKNLSFPFKVISSLIKARTIINRFKPDVVVGVGGFASGPVLRIATNKSIPSVIQEQNSFPGITNRLLSKKVNKICVAYDGMEKYFPKEKIVLTGNPVRKDVIEIEGKKDEAHKYFELESGKKTVLVIGGSQGALAINKSIHADLGKFIKHNFQLIWQTGKYYFETAQAAAKDMSSNGIRVKEFIDKMDYAYSLADVIISRAGAIAISEICAVGKPVILVPLPTAAEDHQTRNATSLVQKNAAIMVCDAEVNSKLTDMVIQLLNDPDGQQALSRNLIKLSHADAADKIADEILALIKNQ